MTTEKEYESRILKYDRDDLVDLWEAVLKEDTPDWSEGRAFEYLLIRAFQIEGAAVRFPYSVLLEGNQIEQIDGAAHTDGMSCLMECKAQKLPLNIEPIAKLRNQLLRRPAGTIGLVFSVNGYTQAALTLAQFVAPQTILLWSKDEIDYALRNTRFRIFLERKYRYCVEYGIPSYNAREAEIS